MAVMAARNVAKRLVSIQRLGALYHQAVEELRHDAVKTTVGTLYNRYKDWCKREGEDKSFAEWLILKKDLEATFNFANGHPTRRRWAFGYFSFLTRKELTLADDRSNLWIFDALEEAINVRHDDPKYVVIVEVVQLDGFPRYNLKPGASLRFLEAERKSLEPTEP